VFEVGSWGWVLPYGVFWGSVWVRPKFYTLWPSRFCRFGSLPSIGGLLYLFEGGVITFHFCARVVGSIVLGDVVLRVSIVGVQISHVLCIFPPFLAVMPYEVWSLFMLLSSITVLLSMCLFPRRFVFPSAVRGLGSVCDDFVECRSRPYE
jgi:hypothetical protein